MYCKRATNTMISKHSFYLLLMWICLVFSLLFLITSSNNAGNDLLHCISLFNRSHRMRYIWFTWRTTFFLLCFKLFFYLYTETEIMYAIDCISYNCWKWTGESMKSKNDIVCLFFNNSIYFVQSILHIIFTKYEYFIALV